MIFLSAFTLLSAVYANSVQDTIGRIDTPPGVTEQIADSGLTGADEVAILFFFNKLITVFVVMMGVWVVVNVMLAAYSYLTGQGNAEAHKKVRDKLTMSVIGLLLLVLAYVATAIISLLFFGDANYILNPSL